MLQIGIEGAGSAEAGELIRLLVNHPDVKVDQICQAEYAGRKVCDIHHGLQGETDLRFCSALDTSRLDIIFVTSSASSQGADSLSGFTGHKTNSDDSGFLIFLGCSDAMLQSAAPFYLRCGTGDGSTCRSQDAAGDDWSQTTVFGVPELNRKPLVRGARRAVIPTAVESLVAVALLPFRHLSPEGISIDVETSADIASELKPHLKALEDRLNRLVADLAGLPGAHVGLNMRAGGGSSRGMKVVLREFGINLPADEARRLVEEEFDDHNMTFLIDKTLDYKEVEGTNNVLVNVSADAGGELCVEAIADARLRGGAGEALHVMNLFAGLFEKTGLCLKASTF